MADSLSSLRLQVFPDDLLQFSQELIQESLMVCVRQSTVNALQPFNLGLKSGCRRKSIPIREAILVMCPVYWFRWGFRRLRLYLLCLYLLFSSVALKFFISKIQIQQKTVPEHLKYLLISSKRLIISLYFKKKKKAPNGELSL